MAARKKLGEILVESGLLDEHQLQSALGHQRQWGGKLGEVLVSRRFASEDAIAECLAAQLDLPRMDLYASGVEARASRLLPGEVAELYQMIPVKVEGLEGERGAFVWVATADPTNIVALDEIQFRTGKAVRPVVVTATQVRVAIGHAYHGEPLVPPEPTGEGAYSKDGAAAPAARRDPHREEELREADIVHEEGEPIVALGAPDDDIDEDIEVVEEPVEGIDDDLALLGFSSGAREEQPKPRPAPSTAAPAAFSISPDEQEAVLASLTPMEAGNRSPEHKPGRPTPEQVVAAMARLLFRKGIITQDELMNELRRK